MALPRAAAPENGTLSIRTGRTGAAAKAGHDLLIHVTAWTATLEVGEDAAPSSSCSTPTPTSLRVREGTGGMKALDDDDKANIQQTIDDEVLKGAAIEFRSTRCAPADGGGFSVEGELTLVGATHPIAFDVAVSDDGALSGGRRRAVRLGHQALLGPVRGAEGRRRGRGRDRALDAWRGPISRRRRSARRARPRRPGGRAPVPCA